MIPRAHSPKTRANADCAAQYPHMPCTPPPGGVELEAMKMRGLGVAYGSRFGNGRAMTCPSVFAPPEMSPPTTFALYVSYAAVFVVCRARMRSRKPGANRSI
jgi:hypothetical protein